MTSTHTTRGDGKLFITPQYVEEVGLASARRVMELCKDGTIKAVRIGRLWRIDREAFNRQFHVDI